MSDDFEEVGLDELNLMKQYKILWHMVAVQDFSNGGAAGADVDFATELEYFFTNPDAELPVIIKLTKKQTIQ